MRHFFIFLFLKIYYSVPLEQRFSLIPVNYYVLFTDISIYYIIGLLSATLNGVLMNYNLYISIISSYIIKWPQNLLLYQYSSGACEWICDFYLNTTAFYKDLYIINQF